MKRLKYTLLLLPFLLIVGEADIATAQYFTPEEGGKDDGYLPESQAEPEPGVDPLMQKRGGIPDVRFGFAADFGGSASQFPSLDRELYKPNDTAELGRYPAFAFDINGFVELVQSVRLGFLGGTRIGGRENVYGQSGHFGFALDAGHAWYNGWSFFAGGGVGLGTYQSESENMAHELYEYSARGLWVRGHARVERGINHWLTLRLTGYYEHTFVKWDEVVVSTPENAPQPVLGEPNGDTNNFGLLFGVVFTTF